MSFRANKSQSRPSLERRSATQRSKKSLPIPDTRWEKSSGKSNCRRKIGVVYLQPQSLPQLHALPLFIGQFLPVSLQFGLSAAKETVHIAATKIESNIFA